jgi:hypothetical protein
MRKEESRTEHHMHCLFLYLFSILCALCSLLQQSSLHESMMVLRLRTDIITDFLLQEKKIFSLLQILKL